MKEKLKFTKEQEPYLITSCEAIKGPDETILKVMTGDGEIYWLNVLMFSHIVESMQGDYEKALEFKKKFPRHYI